MDHAWKLHKRVLDKSLHEIDKIQCGFMPGRSTAGDVGAQKANEEAQCKGKKNTFCFC